MPWLLVVFPPIKDLLLLLLWRGVCHLLPASQLPLKTFAGDFLLYETDDADDVGLVGWFQIQRCDQSKVLLLQWY